MEREAVVLRDREITALAGALRTGGDDPVGRR
jgi:hypothetical protein